jgi:hypothetical protein
MEDEEALFLAVPGEAIPGNWWRGARDLQRNSRDA